MKNQIIIGVILFIVLTVGILFDNSPKMSERRGINVSGQTVAVTKNANNLKEINNNSISGSDNLNFNDAAGSLNNRSANYYNQQNSSQNALGARNSFADKGEVEKPQPKEKFPLLVENIDWNKWRSRFVNTILNDSSKLDEFMSHPDGYWLYYSFWVHKDGTITDIAVRSIYFNDIAKREFYDLIKSYEHKPITEFLPNTRREKVKVKAVIVLSTQDAGVDPSMFHDIESYQH